MKIHKNVFLSQKYIFTSKIKSLKQINLKTSHNQDTMCLLMKNIQLCKFCSFPKLK